MATITGNDDDNGLSGTAGDDSIIGNGGSDGIKGGAGNDTLIGDDGDKAPLAGSLIYESDFENNAAGWSPPNWDNSDPYFGGILGRFQGTSNANDVEVSRSFGLDTTYNDAVIEFDFHRIDSWDNHAFQIYSGGQQIFTQNFGVGTSVGGSNTVTIGGVTYTTTLTSLGNDGPFGYWTNGQFWTDDQSFRVRIEIENAPATLDLGFGSTLDQNVDDESYAFDNFAVISTDDTSIDVQPFVNADDSIYGGDGDDLICGEEGRDELYGGAGNDTIDGGENGDIMFGGDDADLFYGGPGDAVDGGEGGDDNDTLVISDPGATVTYTSTDGEDGFVTFSDGSVMKFQNIEDVILPCFTVGTLIRTPEGERPIEELEIGDLVDTVDRGPQPIRWIGQRKVFAERSFCPVEFAPGAIGNQRTLRVSQQHRMLVTDPDLQTLFETDEVLVPAKFFLNDHSIRLVANEWVTYMHLLFDDHEIIWAEGVETEALLATDQGLGGLAQHSKDEVLAIFPELEMMPHQAARRCLKRYEAVIALGQ